MISTDRETGDRHFLKEAARIALRGRGFVEPNPVVGAVLVQAGRIVARGWHANYGGPHAEPAALRKAGDETRGGTLYVTLEPCSTTGKTPPCTDAIVTAGVRRVVVGALDPNPAHNGRGLRLLEEKGIEAVSLPDERCDELISRFRSTLSARRPWAILKWAMTLDGRIAARDGSSKWISGERSRRIVQRLRGHADAVMVGIGTVLRDDPRLNCRQKGMPRVPARVVIDPHLRTPAGARMFQLDGRGAAAAGPVWIVTAADPGRARAEVLERAGANLIHLQCDGDSHTLFLEKALDALWDRGVRRLLVEGGSVLFTSFAEAAAADQVVAFVAPRLVGGREAPSPLEGEGAPAMKDARGLVDVSVTRSGDDAMMVGFFR